MAKLEIWQKRQWILEHKKRLKWEAKHQGKQYRSMDPFYGEVSRYNCDLCGDRYYYFRNRGDRDEPQYHKHKERYLIICHACWHLKGFYQKHQKAASIEGLSGCRFCHLQLAAKLARKRYLRSAARQDLSNGRGPGQTEQGTTDWQPKRVRSRPSVPEVRVDSADAQRERPARRVRRKVSYA